MAWQAKYLRELQEALRDTHMTVQLPLLPAEVRGVQNLSSFSDRLLTLDPKLDPNASASAERNPLAALEFAPQGAYQATTDAKFMNAAAMEVEDVEEAEGDDEAAVRPLKAGGGWGGAVV